MTTQTTHTPASAMTSPAASTAPHGAGEPADFEAALAPFRLGPPPDDYPPAIVQAVNLGFSIAADMLGVHQTCPRKKCRKSCTAGLHHTCEAEFPARAFDMVLAMQLFLMEMPHDTMMALHLNRLSSRAARADRSAAAAREDPVGPADW